MQHGVPTRALALGQPHAPSKARGPPPSSRAATPPQPGHTYTSLFLPRASAFFFSYMSRAEGITRETMAAATMFVTMDLE